MRESQRSHLELLPSLSSQFNSFKCSSFLVCEIGECDDGTDWVYEP